MLAAVARHRNRAAAAARDRRGGPDTGRFRIETDAPATIPRSAARHRNGAARATVLIGRSMAWPQRAPSAQILKRFVEYSLRPLLNNVLRTQSSLSSTAKDSLSPARPIAVRPPTEDALCLNAASNSAERAAGASARRQIVGARCWGGSSVPTSAPQPPPRRSATPRYPGSESSRAANSWPQLLA